MKRILLVEDEAGLVLTITDRLRAEGYEPESASDGMEGFRRASAESWDLILLDVMLPGRNGLDICRDLRQVGNNTPVLMLTARGQLIDKVLGLKIGADDYLTKPFEMLELLARIEALLRRSGDSGRQNASVHDFGHLRVDLRKTAVWRSGQVVPLSAREFQLLRYLIEHSGTTVSREQLLKEVWGYDGATSTRTVDVHVAWLRQKLEEDPRQPRLIRTVHGFGYQFEPDDVKSA